MYWVLTLHVERHMDVLGINITLGETHGCIGYYTSHYTWRDTLDVLGNNITRGETHGCIGYSHYTWGDTWMYWVLTSHVGRHMDVLGINITRGETHGCIGY